MWLSRIGRTGFATSLTTPANKGPATAPVAVKANPIFKASRLFIPDSPSIPDQSPRLLLKPSDRPQRLSTTPHAPTQKSSLLNSAHEPFPPRPHGRRTRSSCNAHPRL